jgi:predicted nucleic acid-binding Zn ribbon protein
MNRKPGPGGIRKEILREWRGCDDALDLNAGVHAAGTFISAILRFAGAKDGLDEDQVRATWKELAGDFIARHSEPVAVKNGHLLLRVTQPVMRFHLEQMKPMLLARIRSQLGEERIKSVKFTLG